VITAVWIAVKAGAAALFGGAVKSFAANWIWLAVAGAAIGGGMWFMSATFNLVRENTALKAAVATYEAAERARAIANDLEEKAAVEAAAAETNNVRVLDGWHGTIIAAPDVANCVSGDTLSRLRQLR
jgi:hypothetical protein